MNYNWMFVLPQEIGKGEQRQIVVSALETCETCNDNNREEELLDVL